MVVGRHFWHVHRRFLFVYQEQHQYHITRARKPSLRRRLQKILGFLFEEVNKKASSFCEDTLGPFFEAPQVSDNLVACRILGV